MQTIEQNVSFLLLTAALLALVFLLLVAVGWKRGRAFRRDPEQAAHYFSRPPRARDIVLLADGSRVTLMEPIDDGERYMAETVAEYGKKSKTVTIAAADVVKIEYYGS